MERHFLGATASVGPGCPCRNLAVEAGAALGVAATATVLFDAEDKGVLVAIGQELDDLLEFPAGGTFVPELLAAAAPVDGLTFFDGLAQGFLVHVSQHQWRTGLCVQRHGGDEAVGIEFWGKGESFLKGGFGLARGKLDGIWGAGAHRGSVASLGGLPK